MPDSQSFGSGSGVSSQDHNSTPDSTGAVLVPIFASSGSLPTEVVVPSLATGDALRVVLAWDHTTVSTQIIGSRRAIFRAVPRYGPPWRGPEAW